MNRPRLIIGCMMLMVADLADAATLRTILAGGETDLPSDTPSGRLDTAGEFGFVGALAISSGGGNYKGSAVAISPEWLLTAGHNTDFNDDGLVDASWSGTFHLPGYGSFGVAQAFTCTEFTGFANPAVNDDLALLHLACRCPWAWAIRRWEAGPVSATSSRWSASGARVTAATATPPTRV